HTQGHALFSIELLREMQARGDLFRDEQGFWNAALELDWERLPARVEAVIAQRIGRLDDALREMLSVASVEGETFTAQVVARVLQREEREVLRQLARVQKEHRLVREIGEVKLAGRSLTRYSFGHALFRQYLYQELSQGQRRLLHGDVAASLESLYDGHAGTVLAQLANRFAEAQDSKKAIHYLVAAGDQARLQNAYQEAVEHYKRALSLLKGTGDYEEAARTQMKLGLTYHNASAFEQARAANEEAFRLWQQVGLRQLPGRPRRAPHALRIAAENPSGKLDPAMVKETPRSLLIQQLFSGLLQLGPDQDLLPDLARGWEVLDRGRRYLFHLRPNASWTDGVVVTAGDFEFAWKRVLDPATASPNASDLFDVKGARSFHLGNGSPDEVGIRALDDLTLQVELEGVRPYFPNMLYVDWAKAVPRHAVEKHGPAWVEPENLVTSGPFCLVSWEPGERFVLARNRDYHRPFSGNVERVEIHLGLGEDRLRHLDMYLAGELDVLYTFSHLPPQTQQKMREDLVGEYRSTPALATCFVGFVHSQPPFDDRRVRQALSMATDRRTLAGVIRHGHVTPATGGFLSPVHAAYSEGIALPYDPDRARRLLAEAGHERGQGLPTITMVNGHASLSVEADLRYLQAQWRDELGVDMEWETVWNMGEFLSRLTNDPPHLFYVRWAGKYADPDDFLLLESAIIWELSRWHNQRYFALLHEARELSDWRERMELYRRADRMLVEEAAVLPLSYDQTQFLVKPWVKRFTSVASPGWFLPQVILEPHGQEE
ncbi:MAG TPA: ABC transporter substrate-binding protein, partial [Candidatus Binatia bacterium]|nr:ABC transporter substrate-binding protein [Candidatus Binatia bacterium]